MAWLELTVETVSQGIEDVAAALTAGGFADLVLEDEAEFEAFLEQNRACWDYIDEELQQKLRGLSQIKLYLESSDASGLETLKSLLQQLKDRDSKNTLGSLALKIKPLTDVDWEESWKDNYPPQQVGRDLVVLPYWLSDTDRSGRKPIILDPGLTFGTGAHPSTQMVMEAMEQAVKPGSNCLDLGSGSGILSITALRLGAQSAIGVDIDPKAEGIARENAAFNGFSAPAFLAYTGDVTADKELMQRLSQREYDIVLVNIVADVIIGLSKILPQFLTEKTVLICSGILDVRLKDVTDALEKAGLTITSIRAKEDWRCVSAQRRTL